MTPDGSRILLGGSDELALWHSPEGRLREIGTEEMINCSAVTSDGRLGICGSFPRKVTLWDLERGKLKRTLLKACWGRLEHEGPGTVQSVALTGDGRHAFAAVDRQGLLSWDLRTGKRRKMSGRMQGISNFLASPDGKHLVCTHKDGGKVIVRIPLCNVVGMLEARGGLSR